MKHKQWQSNNNSSYKITGDLDRDSVPDMWHEIQAWQLPSSDLEVCLDQLERIDSAGMVMLIHLIQHAKMQNCHIMLSFVPDELKMLFQLSNVEAIVAGHIKD
jgi:phospholipid transport system transporter-binding protein